MRRSQRRFDPNQPDVWNVPKIPSTNLIYRNVGHLRSGNQKEHTGNAHDTCVLGAETRTTMKACAVIASTSVLSVALVLSAAAQQQTTQPVSDKLIAIDVLLQPDRTMVSKANEINARLRGNYPEGYSLDAMHAPHVTMLQLFIREKDFDAVTAAITKLLAVERPWDLQLKATSLIYQIWNGVALTAIVVARTPELTRLQQKVTDALAPFSATGGTEAAFIDTPPGADIVSYVETFVPKASGANYFPHVTAGVATEAFVKQLMAEPFEATTFKPAGVAIYQLGNFGTASKKLKEWDVSH
jgi:2'-5' RNA ligase superfamily